MGVFAVLYGLVCAKVGRIITPTFLRPIKLLTREKNGALFWFFVTWITIMGILWTVVCGFLWYIFLQYI